MNENNENKKDFSLIFDEIEIYKETNPSFSEVGINDEDIQNDDAIREFTNICRELSSNNCPPVEYNIFS